VQALERFESVRTEVAAELDRLLAQGRAALRDFAVGLEDRQARARAYLQHLSGELEATYARLQLELVPYGHALREMAGKMLEKHVQTLFSQVPPATPAR
jgi:hypothetical protein